MGSKLILKIKKQNLIRVKTKNLSQGSRSHQRQQQRCRWGHWDDRRPMLSRSHQHAQGSGDRAKVLQALWLAQRWYGFRWKKWQEFSLKFISHQFFHLSHPTQRLIQFIDLSWRITTRTSILSIPTQMATELPLLCRSMCLINEQSSWHDHCRSLILATRGQRKMKATPTLAQVLTPSFPCIHGSRIIYLEDFEDVPFDAVASGCANIKNW